MPAVNNVQSDVDKLTNDLETAFQNFDSSISITEAFKTIGQDLAITFVDLVKNIVEGIVKIFRDVILWIKQLGTATIQIPIFSALYKDITGADLSVFDAICLVIAIPATILAKVVTGSGFPDLSSQLNSPGYFQSYIDGTAPPNEINQINSIAAYGSIATGLLGVAIGMIGLALDAADESGALEEIRAPSALRPSSKVAVSNITDFQKLSVTSLEPNVLAAYDLCNIVTGLSNTFLAVPISKNLE